MDFNEVYNNDMPSTFLQNFPLTANEQSKLFTTLDSEELYLQHEEEEYENGLISEHFNNVNDINLQESLEFTYQPAFNKDDAETGKSCNIYISGSSFSDVEKSDVGEKLIVNETFVDNNFKSSSSKAYHDPQTIDNHDSDDVTSSCDSIFWNQSNSKTTFPPQKNKNSFAVYLGNKRAGGDSNSKNAMAARDNRLKKKKYVADLEETVSNLRKDNAYLKKENENCKSCVKSLETEVSYLKSVIANQTTLSAILNNVLKTPGIKLSSSFTANNSAVKKEVNNSHTLKRKSYNNNAVDQVPAKKIKNAAYSLRSSKKEISVNHSYDTASMSHDRPTCQKLKQQIDMKFNKRDKIKNKSCKKDLDEYFLNVEDVSDSESDSSLKSLNSNPKQQLDSNVSPGICFHVSGNNVSLEFCSLCSSRAQSGVVLDHNYVKI
ncbi:uncharacterized protein LOC131940805 [Physella acuta]|uniref:uncharacterized protein LOC131940805 n=1 Tax=Physella acuta TaxID=109671 RepID=UPI0027DACF87|nr:uncharacterized protein LOC131940805 [Physella acuta]